MPGCSDDDSNNGADSDPYSDTEVGASGPIDGRYFCRPASAGNDRLLINLVGTRGDPTDVLSYAFLLHACTHGFAAVAPVYNNDSPGRLVCRDDNACYEAFHREILFGGEGAPSPVEVGPGESIVERVSDLLHTLSVEDAGFDWAAIASKFDDEELERVSVSGHSQGNGHALYWARERLFHSAYSWAEWPTGWRRVRRTMPVSPG